jgi:hypothetical protein
LPHCTIVTLINPSCYLGELIKKVHAILVKFSVTKPKLTGGTHGHPNCSSLLPL